MENIRRLSIGLSSLVQLKSLKEHYIFSGLFYHVFFFDRKKVGGRVSNTAENVSAVAFAEFSYFGQGLFLVHSPPLP